MDDTDVSENCQAASHCGEWLLLLYSLPPKPDYLRVKIWRRLQALGAIAVRGSVHVLPSTERMREDFQWLRTEIEGLGGEASICSARFVDGLSDAQLRGLFDRARDSDYEGLIAELQLMLAEARAGGVAEDLASRQRKLRRRFEQIVAIDHFGAPGRAIANVLFAQLNGALEHAARADGSRGAAVVASGRTWVTRRGVGVDRMACAWLIRRFIDPAAQLGFVEPGAVPPAEVLSYDIEGGNYSHLADRCTFEVLLERFALHDPALGHIGRIIHDLDMKDARFCEDETAGVAMLLRGIEALHGDDDQRIRTAALCLDALYAAQRYGLARADDP